MSHLPGIGPQMLWKDYCVAGTVGAEVHRDLISRPSDIIINCGIHPSRDNCIYKYYVNNNNN